MTHDFTALWRGVRARLRIGHGGRLSVAEAYDRWSATYGSRMNPLQKLEEAALQRLLPDLSGRTVLDVGCGTGRVSRFALERGAASVVGVDPSPSMLNEARAETAPSLAFVHGDVYALPFDASTFDVVTCTLVLGHVERLDAALSEMNRVLRHGGHIVLSGFHPFATLRGWDRTFADGASGRTYAIVQHVHLFEDYFRGFQEHHWSVEAFEEPLYGGFPVAFVLRARKTEAE